jgi:outer membrane lipoprotein-sorting protein
MIRFLVIFFITCPLFAQASVIDNIEKYLNNISSLTADFIQIDASGESSTGILYILRPGKLRWQYHPPVPILIVVNDSLLTYYDFELKQVSNASAANNMIGFLARKNISFTKDVKVTDIIANAGSIRINLTQLAKDRNEKINLIFNQDPILIKKIEIIDEAGNFTSITLNNVKYGVKIDPKLFYANQLENK